MLVKFTGGPLDGLVRTMESRDLDAVIVAHGWEPRDDATSLAQLWPEEHPGEWRQRGRVRYTGRQWRDGEGRMICVEYVCEAVEGGS